MNTNKMGTLLAMAIAAAIPFAGGAADKPKLSVRDVAVVPARSQSDPVQRIIINYREGSLARSNSAAAVQDINRVLSRSGVSAQALGGAGVSHMRKLATGHDLIKLPGAVDRVTANALMRQIATNPDVLSVEVDEIVYALDFPADPPNDRLYQDYQWHFHAPDGNTGNVDAIANRGGANVAEAWKLADGSGITVAVIDTGIVAHEDMDTSYADTGYDFISDAFRSGRNSDARAPGGWDPGDWTIGYPGAENCPPTSRNQRSSWHGTHVAGTVGAQLTNNGIGVAGIAHAAKVVPVRTLGHCGGRTSDTADAIVWASGGNVPGVPANPNPAHVINMSLGGEGACTSAERAAIAGARARGTVVVVAAGNENENATNHSPANCPGVITVAATGIGGTRASYSNYGTVVDISAPGNDVAQAYNRGQTVPEAGNDGYALMSGTSQATPHVAGVVALMQSARLAAGLDLLTPDQVLAYLQETVTPFPAAPDQPIGSGIVNAAAAVTRAIGATTPEPPPPEPEPPTPEPPPSEPDPSATPILNNTPIKGLSGGSGTWVLTVPEGARGPLSIITSGGTGDLTLLVHAGGAPANNADWSLRSTRRGNNETVRINNPQPGDYYIRLVGEPRAYSGVTLRAMHK